MEVFQDLEFLVKSYNYIMKIHVKNISKKNFSKFGQLITTKDNKFENINNESSKSFSDLVDIKIYGEDNQCRVNIFQASKRIFPLKINMLEKHPFSSQAFIPLQKTNFITFHYAIHSSFANLN